MSSFVLDTSIAMKWFLEDEDDRDYSLNVLQAMTDQFRPVVPWLWYYEIANNLVIQVRRKRVLYDSVASYLTIIGDMPIDIDKPARSSILQLPYLAHQHGTVMSPQLSTTPAGGRRWLDDTGRCFRCVGVRRGSSNFQVGRIVPIHR